MIYTVEYIPPSSSTIFFTDRPLLHLPRVLSTRFTIKKTPQAFFFFFFFYLFFSFLFFAFPVPVAVAVAVAVTALLPSSLQSNSHIPSFLLFGSRVEYTPPPPCLLFFSLFECTSRNLRVLDKLQ